MRIGRWSISHPQLALSAWLAFVVACVALGAISGTKTLDNGAVGESARGYAIMNKEDLWGPPNELAFLHTLRSRVPVAAVTDVEQHFRGLGLRPQLKLSADHRSAVVVVHPPNDHAVE